MGDLYYRGLQAMMYRQRRADSEAALRAQKEVESCTWKPQINVLPRASTMHDFGRKWNEDRNQKIARLQAQKESQEKEVNPLSPQVDAKHRHKTEVILSCAGGYVDPQSSWKQRAQRYHEIRSGTLRDMEPLPAQRPPGGTHWREVVERLYPARSADSAASDGPDKDELEEREEQSDDVAHIVLSSAPPSARASPRIMELYENGRQKMEIRRRPPPAPEEMTPQRDVAQLLGESPPPMEPHPTLNKKSLQIAGQKDRRPLHWRARPSSAHSFEPPTRRPEDAEERLKDFTNRTVNYQEWKARKAEDRKAKQDAAEIAGCTFSPQTLNVATPCRDDKRPFQQRKVYLGLDDRSEGPDPADEYLQQATAAYEAWEEAQLQAAALVREAVAKGALNVAALMESNVEPPKSESKTQIEDMSDPQDASPTPRSQGKVKSPRPKSCLVAFGHRVDQPLARKTPASGPISPRGPTSPRGTTSPRGHPKQQAARTSNCAAKAPADAPSTPRYIDRTAPSHTPRTAPLHPQSSDSVVDWIAGAHPAHAQSASASVSWSARAVPKPKPQSKGQTLYEQGALRKKEQKAQAQEALQKRLEQEMEGCTFRPKLHSWIRK